MEKFNPKKSSDRQSKKLIIGIGNPGEKYESTYHNAGLLFISFLKKNLVEKLYFKTHKSSTFSYAKLGEVFIVRSNVFMNDSGKAVSQAMRFFHITTKEMLIVHDDADILLGKYKMCFDRGTAGHHGIDSIVKHIGTKSFWRLRIGIGKNTKHKQPDINKKREKAGLFVLKHITPADKKILEESFIKALTEIFT